MVAVTGHTARWLSPEPMWTQKNGGQGEAAPSDFVRPAILRFNHDLFMEELLAVLAYKPDHLSEWEATPENWRRPMPNPPTAQQLAVVDPISKRSREVAKQVVKPDTTAISNIDDKQDDDETLPLKLYQPIQQRHYLVTSSLVCRRKGLPDRLVNPGRQEQVGFVVRRLFTEKDPGTNISTTYEYAYIRQPDGYVWKRLSEGAAPFLQSEEERLPMFTLTYDREPHPRKILAGSIPVGKRETYLSAGRDDGDGLVGSVTNGGTQPDSRRLLFDAQVVGPWKAIVEQAAFAYKQLHPDVILTFPGVDENLQNVKDKKTADKIGALKIAREQIQTASWYILVDLMDFLKTHLENVWNVVIGNSLLSTLKTPEESEVYEALKEIECEFSALEALSGLTPGGHRTELLETLKHLHSNPTIVDDLEEVEIDYALDGDSSDDEWKWPNFRFAFIDPMANGEELEAALPNTLASETLSMAVSDALLEKIGSLSDLVEKALATSDSPLVEMTAPMPPFDDSGKEPWFVIRCVYERPNCGPLNPTVVSAPTVKFQMAAFFDPDAPTRPVRIPMPLDISPAGLRKFKKNATFMISDALCGKIKRIRQLTLGDLVLSVLPWPFHKDLPSVGPAGSCSGSSGSFGMFCSLSIPIVTLCALILLIIIVALFDIFFKWIPYLFFCFPIPGLKGKNK